VRKTYRRNSIHLKTAKNRVGAKVEMKPIEEEDE